MVVQTRSKRARPDPTEPPSKRASASSSCENAAASDDDDSDAVDVHIRDVFHGQLRLFAGGRPPMAGQPAARMSWKSALLTTQPQFDKFVRSVNDTSYSKTSGKGGARLDEPVKRARPAWGRQAVLVVVSRAPFARHQLCIERRARGEYWALAKLVEKRGLAAPSGLGSFDACVFDLADDDASA